MYIVYFTLFFFTVDDENDGGDNNRSDGDEVYFDEALYPLCKKLSATTSGRAV
jgi:hypothetical protein